MCPVQEGAFSPLEAMQGARVRLSEDILWGGGDGFYRHGPEEPIELHRVLVVGPSPVRVICGGAPLRRVVEYLVSQKHSGCVNGYLGQGAAGVLTYKQ